MAYVILNPGSITNPGGKYTVTDYDKWVAHANGDRSAFPVEGEFTSYGDAVTRRDELNRS
ncbi:hypothetical protein [Actinomadura sp. NEAU-AAG7]|uniref:hypothetical protein n=1 Tax=Actinomadura sp. NEAU-AAG7 TaxID=2839640 RepID=UPI001BE3E544|nr:hypothetical protein [Actinomadura sp. NEAU-AAG7]MBT2213499.1 hypothetical protein [Actinomadura sp. NEAU-AAG7]